MRPRIHQNTNNHSLKYLESVKKCHKVQFVAGLSQYQCPLWVLVCVRNHPTSS